MNFQQTLALTLLFICTISLHAQQYETANYPIPGQSIPEFKLTDVDYYSKDQVTPADFKGKWLIMDFWTQYCSSCIASFPKINELQKTFKNNIQFLLVGKNDQRNSNSRKLFELFREKQQLELVIAYDSVLFEQYGIQTVPHIVIVNPDGIVYAVTHSSSLSEDKLRALLDGGTPSFTRKYSTHEQETAIKPKSPWRELVRDLDSLDFEINTSLLTKWSEEDSYSIRTEIRQYEIDHATLKSTGTSLTRLYNLAYVGRSNWGMIDSLYTKFWRYPVAELEDPSLFEDPYQAQFNYYLKVSKNKSSKEYLQWAMRCDLKKHFGYEVSIETRMMPYWSVTTVSDQAKQELTAKSSERFPNGKVVYHLKGYGGYTMNNVSVGKLIFLIYKDHQKMPMPTIDETGIEGNIDITLHAAMTDFEDVRRSLRESGIELVKKKKPMRVLVIRDSDSPSPGGG